MNRPEDIPEDVWVTAVATRGAASLVETIARAIMAAEERATLAERERCATFVETMAVARGYAGGMTRGAEFVRRTNPSGSARQIAAAIRKGGA